MTTSWKFGAIGTTWSIELAGDFTQKMSLELQRTVTARIDQFDKTYSRFRADSVLQTWSEPGTYPMPADGYTLFSLYRKLYEATGGKLTPLIGSLMSEAGYDPDYSFVPKTLHQPPAWDTALDFDQEMLTVKRPVSFDVGAAGKGYLIDIIIDMLSGTPPIDSVIINAGGDIRHWNRYGENLQSLRIGLENPFNHSEVIGITELRSGSLCASAGSRRTWGKFHHIIDPQALESPREVIATWVASEEAMVADGLATALFFVPPTRLQHFKFGYAILHSDGTLEHSPHFLSEVYTR